MVVTSEALGVLQISSKLVHFQRSYILCKRFVKNSVDELATVHECVRAMTTSYIYS